MKETTWKALLAPETLGHALAAVVLLIIGLLLARLASRAAHRLVERRGTAQQALIARRAVYSFVLTITGAAVLRQLGVDLSVVLGAAGVLTVAIGFAAQASASNLISGLFLLGERHFMIGDLIRVGSSIGQVVSIDLLSVKLRTLDNLSVRVPNETLIKTEIINYTRHPIRRVDLRVRVDYRSDLEVVRGALLDVARTESLCLEEPLPFVQVRALGDSGIELQLSVWTTSAEYENVRSAVQESIVAALAEQGVAIAVSGFTTPVSLGADLTALP